MLKHKKLKYGDKSFLPDVDKISVIIKVFDAFQLKTHKIHPMNPPLFDRHKRGDYSQPIKKGSESFFGKPWSLTTDFQSGGLWSPGGARGSVWDTHTEDAC